MQRGRTVPVLDIGIAAGLQKRVQDPCFRDFGGMVKSRPAVGIRNVRIGSLGEQPLHLTGIAVPGRGAEFAFFNGFRPGHVRRGQQQGCSQHGGSCHPTWCADDRSCHWNTPAFAIVG